MSIGWIVIRSSGLIAFGLLAAATVWGLVLSLRVRPRSAKSMTLAHEALSVGALVATAVHMVALWLHDYLEFTVDELLVPGVSDWRPVAVAWGVVAFYGMVVVTVSFYLRSHIGQRQWRLLHFASFGVFVGALVHGVLAGTDTQHTAVLALYGSAVVAVAVLVAMQLSSLTARAPRTVEDRAG